MGESSNNDGARIKLYTNTFSGFGHKVQITLHELGLEYEEVEVDLNNKSEEFLNASSRGLVPALTFDHPSFGQPRHLIESTPIVHFLLDAYSHRSQNLWPPPTDPETAYFRYRVSFLIDTFVTKVEQPHWFKLVFSSGTDKVNECVDEAVAAIREHIEPLLGDANPFFGGKPSVTLAEIMIGPSLIRLYTWADDRLLPKSLAEKLDDLPYFSKWAKATISRQSVNCKWDREFQSKLALEIIPKARVKYGY